LSDWNLWGDGVEEFGSARETKTVDFEEELPGHLDSGIDRVGTIHIRIIDEALPSHCGTRLFEIDSHHHH